MRLVKQSIYQFIKKYERVLTTFVVLFGFFLLILPSPLFEDPVCTVITDRNGVLLGAHIASDGQYRFPETDSVSDKFAESIIAFEDKRFRRHIGVDFRAFGRAILQNIKARSVVSGGSTLTMQVIRLSRKNKSRTYFEKIIEVALATRIELSYSKDEILRLYASYSPFGGNVVGIDAAAWRYFGTIPEKLTWAEAATLAVLPNSPTLIRPGKNQSQLLDKRNRLLKKLQEIGKISQEIYELSLTEPLPEAPNPFPNDAAHLLDKARLSKKYNSIKKTTLIADYQIKINALVRSHHNYMKQNQVNNAAAIVLDTETGEVVAYVGNLTDFSDVTNGNFVDIIQSERSTGSILKPFLYASMLSDGELLPNTLVYDIPTRFGGFAPKNYNRGYVGAVPANEALARSLNIPAARMLRDYGIGKFYRKLEQAGMTTLHENARHYGLSLILGGCEAKLWDLVGMYSSMARSLKNFNARGNKYLPHDYHEPIVFQSNTKKKKYDWTDYEETSDFDASAIWFMFKAMLDVERPSTESNWEMFSSSEPIAWKTGTSFGFRDAWAVGVTPRYTVGVWVGNADGEGRPGVVGVYAAAPLLFDIFDVLPDAESWFSFPEKDMAEAEICTKSGYLAGANCTETELRAIPKSGLNFEVCPYHKIVHLDKERRFRVHAGCESTENFMSESWFILPPSVENYYKSKNADYKFLPPFRSDCSDNESGSNAEMDLIYPHSELKIFVPVELDGTPGRTVFEAAHRRTDAKIFWYLDKKLIAQTDNIHSIELRPAKGSHTLTLTDDKGESLTRIFEVLSEK